MAKTWQASIRRSSDYIFRRLLAGAACEIRCTHGTSAADEYGSSKRHGSFFADSQGRIPKLDPKQLKAGQHIQILTGDVPDAHVPEILMHFRL